MWRSTLIYLSWIFPPLSFTGWSPMFSISFSQCGILQIYCTIIHCSQWARIMEIAIRLSQRNWDGEGCIEVGWGLKCMHFFHKKMNAQFNVPLTMSFHKLPFKEIKVPYFKYSIALENSTNGKRYVFQINWNSNFIIPLSGGYTRKSQTL